MTEGKRTRVNLDEYLKDTGKVLRDAEHVPHVCIEDDKGRVVMTIVRQRTSLCEEDDTL